MPLTLNFVTDCGAPTDGVTSCDTAMTSWLTQAIANDGSTLIIPAYNGIGVNSPYHLAAVNGFGNGVKNCTITAQSGASINSGFIGKANLLAGDFTHSSRIATVPVGVTSVTLKTPAEISRFSVGQWIMVAGLALQASPTYPPNFEYTEFRQITGIVGPTISFTGPLQFTYLDTWPLVDPSHTVQSYDTGGPATIYAMDASFSGTQTWSGLKVVGTTGVGISGGAGEGITLTNMDFSTCNGPSPSMGKSWVMQNCQIGAQNEVDKCLEYLEYNNCTGAQILVASAAPTLLTIKNNSNITTLNGTAYNTSIEDTSSIGTLIIGAGGFGRSNNLSVTTTQPISTLIVDTHNDDLVNLSFSGGVFTVANAADIYDALRLFVPGFKYAFGFYDGAQHVIDNLGKINSFTCTGITQDATNVYINTDCPSIPTTTYAGNPPATIFAYGVKTLTPPNSSILALPIAVENVSTSTTTVFSVIHDNGKRHTKMIGY